MNIRTVLAVILGIAFMSCISLAQESASPEPALEEPLLVETPSPEPMQEEPTSAAFASAESRRVRSVSRARSSSSETMVRIFVLEYYPVDELEELIESIFDLDGDKIHANRSTNQLILQATKGQMANIETLIAELDAPVSRLESSQTVENLLYRVYMFEIDSQDRDMKPFSMILQTPSRVSSQELLDAVTTEDLRISEFLQSGDVNEPLAEIMIQGKAASNDSLKRLVDMFPESHITELQWEDESSTDEVAAAHYSRLPERLLTHIQKFLGENIVTVGYWFGSSSIPGEVEAPIGPWRLHLELNKEPDRALEFQVEVEAPEERSDFDRQHRREGSVEILSNTIQAKIGKPIIIGYNRQSYGTRKMGAMVILPEVDTIEAKEN